MDDVKFDQLAKVLGRGGTRRAANRLLAGGALGTLVGRLGLAPAVGANGGNCRGSRASCVRDKDCCSGRCDEGFCNCKKRGKCDSDKACCSKKCEDGKCKKGKKLVSPSSCRRQTVNCIYYGPKGGPTKVVVGKLGEYDMCAPSICCQPCHASSQQLTAECKAKFQQYYERDISANWECW